jgi:hypothetical protein
LAGDEIAILRDVIGGVAGDIVRLGLDGLRDARKRVTLLDEIQQPIDRRNSQVDSGRKRLLELVNGVGPEEGFDGSAGAVGEAGDGLSLTSDILGEREPAG